MLSTVLALLGCSSDPEDPPHSSADPETSDTAPAAPQRVRFATFNVSLFRGRAGQLADDLADPSHPQARLAAQILQDAHPDVVLLNEFDRDDAGLAAERFRDDFLAVSQDGREPLDLPYTWVPTVNTGVPSGQDLGHDGAVTTDPGSEAYGNDCYGFGTFPGQYGLVVLSRFPIVEAEIRTFQELLWKDVPDVRLPDDPATDTPDDWYSPAARQVLRLSSKTHADVPITIGDTTVHFLVSHPTPPSFDGPEDHNGLRNHDEIRFWRDYLDGGPDSWHVDDAGERGALTDQPFVLVGDLNNDPHDGDGDGTITQALLDHPRVGSTPTPTSPGAVEQAALQGGRNTSHQGDPAEDTADFNDDTVGNLRIDYVLPSVDLPVVGNGVWWPASDDPAFAPVGTFPFPVSDHRLVWVDVDVGVPK